MKLIFPGKYEGFEILKYLSITIPFVILTQTTTSILQGVGKLYSSCYKLIYRMYSKTYINTYISSNA